MPNEKETQPQLDEGAGGCKECTCPSWRGDSDTPERCVNIRVPTKQLCGHTKAQHR